MGKPTGFLEFTRELPAKRARGGKNERLQGICRALFRAES